MSPAFASAAPLATRAAQPPAFSPRRLAPSVHPPPRLAVRRAARWVAVAGPPSPPSDADRTDDDESTSSDRGGSAGGNDDFAPTPKSDAGSARSSAGRSDDGTRDAEFDVDLPADAPDQNELFQFVKQVPPPELVKRFTQSAPPVVQNAIRETLVSMLGSLPPLAFSSSVSTMSSNLVQLFHSSLVTGYMFRNATYRLELTRSLDWGGIKALPGTGEGGPEIRGGVAVFKQGDGSSMEVPVEKYVEELRQTVQSLQGELQRERKGGNELLSFISTMEKESMEALTKNAGEEVVEAMKKVVGVVTKAQGIDTKQEAMVHASAPELGQLLFYLMVSGFFLREAEVHLDLQRKLGGDGSSLKNLLEGGQDSS